jgi:hypothetical protein
MKFRKGDFVRVVGSGTDRFPVASRYFRRAAKVVRARRMGRGQILDLEIHDRVTPLRVTNTTVDPVLVSR